MNDTDIRYVAEYQDTVGGPWFVAGDIYGYESRDDADAALAGEEFKRLQRFDRPNIIAKRVWKITTTQELA